MKEPQCPTCGTPLEWSTRLRRYLPCHTGAATTAVIRAASKQRRLAVGINLATRRAYNPELRREYMRLKQRESRARRQG